MIVGAGCVGASIARELSKYEVSVLLLEAADDVTQGATKGNSGIVHAGFDDTPGSVRAKFCWRGNQMFGELDRELRFGFQRNGSLVVATNAEEMAHLEELEKRGKKNGVQRLRIVDREELRRMEPHLSDACIGALYSPDAGNVIPYEFAVALAENAADNGVEIRIRREVSSIDLVDDDRKDGAVFTVRARHWEPKNFIDATIGPNVEQQNQQNQQNQQEDKKRDVDGRRMTPQMIGMLGGFLLGVLAIFFKSFKVPMMYQGLTLLALFVAGSLAYYRRRGVGASSAASKKANKSNIPASVGTGGRIVTFVEMATGGSGSSSVMQGQTVNEEVFRARCVINCAGLGADRVANMIGDKSFTIKPRIGDYLLFNRNQGFLTHRTIFPCPGPMGKGVLVQQTLWGNLILGPTARDVHIPEHVNQSPDEVHHFILEKCRKLCPTFDPKEVIHAFSGARAKSSRNDWIVEPSSVDRRFIHAAGIDSPGLAGCPAVALEIVRLVHESAGLELRRKSHFNPNRAAIIVPKDGFRGLKMSKFEDRPNVPSSSARVDPRVNVVCKCEKVTEAEIIEAVSNRALPVDSTQAVRKRTRAGMGWCQARPDNYDCERRVAEIVARELQLPVEAVGRRPWPASSTLGKRWINDEDKARLVRLAQPDGKL